MKKILKTNTFDMYFPCTTCGECCRHINLIQELSEFDDGSGKCIHLLDSNLCEIYSNRPDVCKIDVMYKMRYCETFSYVEFLHLNAISCNKIQKIAGIPVEYRVSVTVKG